jgi:UDP-N-acetylmuramoyl-tripeptide--D-alanyl-D-alanine ligase
MSARPSLDSSFIARALAAEITAREGPEAAFKRAVIDSRLVESGDLFVALPGERVDGHDFALDAAQRGASGLLLSRPVAGAEDLPRFVVHDTLLALQRLAVAWRDALPHLEVVGVTGNVGKSTTKLITAAVLGTRYLVQAHRANYNNEIGVPLCLLELQPDTERGVIEMGMYTTGEIALLCEWTHPRIGIVLNVGPVHLERAGSLDAIARAKRELPEALPPGGHAILNIDDPLVEAMIPHTSARVWRTGTSPAAEVRGTDVVSRGAAGFEFRLTHEDRSRRVHVPLPGGHLVSNVLAAAACGLADGIAFDDVCAALTALDVPTRLTIHRLPDGVTILDDTYNASPVATIAALDLLGETPGRRLALLGDMLELGDLSAAEHARVGRHAAEVVDVLFTVGRLARGISDAAHGAGLDAATHCDSKDEALERVRAELRAGDVLLVKASRALALETVVQALTGHSAASSEESRAR